MGGQVTVAFYDTSTLYFESQEDDVRVPGYSKDGKNENPQVVLGGLVAAGGNPIGYELHKGNLYKGTTLLAIVKKLEKPKESVNKRGYNLIPAGGNRNLLILGCYCTFSFTHLGED